VPSVKVHDGNVDKALRKLKKKVANDKILETVRKKQQYEKPSEIRKRKKSAAIARWKKKLEKEKLPTKDY